MYALSITSDQPTAGVQGPTSCCTNQTTAPDRGLSTMMIAGDLESGMAVVIKPTHKPRVEIKWNGQIAQKNHTASKRCALFSLRESNNVGASASNAWVVEFLLSRMRKGLVIIRWWQSATNWSHRASSQFTNCWR